MKLIRKSTLIVLLFVATISQAQKNNFKLTCNFPDLKADSIYMQVFDDKQMDMKTITATNCTNGKFTLEGYIEHEMYYDIVAKKKEIPFNKSIHGQIFVEKRALMYSGEFGPFPVYKVKGGKYTDNIYKYCSNPEYLKLRKEYLAYNNSHELSDKEKIALRTLGNNLYMYSGNINYKWFDEAHPLHQIYLADQYYCDKEYDKFKDQAAYVIKTYPNHPEARRIQRVLSWYEEDEQKAKDGKKEKETTRIGTHFTDVIVKDVNGKEYKLSDVVKNNKLVLLDFWASWCGPCRAEFPHLRLAYKAYKSKGFEIFAVSLDEKQDNWLKALNEEKTEWINLVDLDGINSKSAKAYKVNAIPYNVLINANGEIIGEILRGEALEKKLEEILN